MTTRCGNQTQAEVEALPLLCPSLVEISARVNSFFTYFCLRHWAPKLLCLVCRVEVPSGGQHRNCTLLALPATSMGEDQGQL